MSIGPAGGIIGSAAGSPLAQSKGSDTERAQQDAAGQLRRVASEQKAESAAGIAETDGEDHQTAERDADGRRLWEGPHADDGTADSPADGAESESQSKDSSGQTGNLLDLSG